MLGGGGPGATEQVALHEAAQSRYLNYALSVITARALPDVRDGLKPVQRRILYTMWQQNLTADTKHRKCAKVVGDVMGSFHPHGDAALYETLVRMAQPLLAAVSAGGRLGQLRLARRRQRRRHAVHRVPSGAAERRAAHRDRAGHRPLPAQLRRHEDRAGRAARAASRTCSSTAPRASPSAWPPTSRRTTWARCARRSLKLLDNEDIGNAQLCRVHQGAGLPDRRPDPELRPRSCKQIYKTGAGSIRLRGTWDIGPETRSTKTIYIDSIPYTVNKAQLVERIAEIVLSRKLPPLLDVKDLSTEDVRIAIEMKKDADEKMVMAYLFKHTPLQINFAVNLTCLIPTENPEVGRPERLDLKQILWHFLHFRLEVVTRRLEHELAALRKRIHVLEGFEKVFDALDEIIRMIRKSDGKADAAEKIMKRFELDAEQTDAILELKIYRLARLEILIIRSELEEKRKRARQIGALLKDEDEPLEARARRARRDPAQVRRQAPDRDRQRRRRARVLRRRLHRRGGQRGDRVARRVGEASEGSQGPVDDAAAGGRRGAGGLRGKHARDLRVLQQLRRRLHRAASSTCPRPPATASRSSGCSS